jgi:metal-responsive CopG/Arc/MetJ family transcriptional regulator
MTELRVDIPDELARRIDALMMVNKLKSRAEYVVPELMRAVEEEFHRATVLLRCAGINPLLSTAVGVERRKSQLDV